MKSKTAGYFIVIACAAVVATVWALVPSLAVESVYPVERARRIFLTRVWPCVSGFFSGAAAGAENVRLRREVASLSLIRGDLKRLADENNRLRRALGYLKHRPGEWQSAGVLSSGGAAAGVRRSLRVDKGSLQGVRTGAVVVVPEGLVGQVTSVTPHTAEVTLLTDRKLQVSCVIETPGGARALGTVAGSGDGNLIVRHLRGAAELPAGSRVRTSGLGGVFPGGLEVGTLLSVGTGPGGVSRMGEILPRVDGFQLEDVFIRHEK